MMLTLLTIVHVIISLVAIGAGFVVIRGWIGGKNLPGWTPLFLWMTVATSATGFLFPFKGITPGIIFGILSLIVFAAAFHALHSRRLSGKWRKVYLITALFAQYLNCFVLIAQLFQKVPALRALAPTQNDPPFAIAQLLLLVLFIVLGVLSIKRFPAVFAAGI